jgi:MFS family permease
MGSVSEVSGTRVAGVGAPARFYGWTLLAVLWLILLANLGFPMYGGAVLNSAMATELHLSRELLGLPFSVFLGVVGLSSPLVALIIGRIGVRATLVLGNLSVALGAVLMASVVRSALMATLVFGGLIGFGVASGGNLTGQTAIARWFVRRRALAFAIMLTASALGGFFAAPAMNWIAVTTSGGWRIGWFVLAAIGISAALLAALLVREWPQDIGQRPDGDAPLTEADRAPVPQQRSWTLADALCSARFWAVSVASAVATGGFGLVLAHGVANARDAGFSPAEAGFSLALISVSGLAGKAIAGPGGDRFDPALIWAGLMASMGVGLAIAAVGLSHAGLYAFSVFLGMGFGGVVVCQPATLAHLFGTFHFAQIASAVYFLQAIAGLLLPWLAGRSFDATHSYRYVFLAVALACLLSSVLLCYCRSRSAARARLP